MKRFSFVFISLLLLFTVNVNAQTTIQPGVPQNSFTAATLTISDGTRFAIPQSRGVIITWQTSYAAAPTSITVLLQGSLDNSNWFTLDTSTSTAGEIRYFGPSSPQFIRCRISAVNVGSGSALTCRINVLPSNNPTAVTGGTFTSNIVMASGTQIRAADGTTSLPSISFANDINTGFYRETDNIFKISLGGSTLLQFDDNPGLTFIPANALFGWSDLRLVRDAANTLAQRNGVNAQAFNLYNTFTDGSNYERLAINWNTSNLRIETQAAGTGLGRNIVLETPSAGVVSLRNSGNEKFFITSTQVAIQQPAVDQPLNILSLATNDDPTETVRQNRVATTDATVTTLQTISVPASTTVGISCMIVSRRTGGASGTAEDGAMYRLEVVLKNVAGTATEIAAETLTVIGESQAGFTAASTPSGANTLIQVTGAAGNNITWHSTCRNWNVGS